MDAFFSFDIITFQSNATVWNPSEETREKCIGEKRLTRDCLVPEAQTKVFYLKAGGSTNINEALLKAVDLAAKIPYDDELKKMIIFLTDGDATSGETNNDVIKEYSQQMELGDSWDSIAFQADSIIIPI